MDRLSEPLPRSRSEKIGEQHLERLAVVYVRQSTVQQVMDHRESTKLQYGLVDRTIAMGAPRADASLRQGLLICGRCSNRMTVRYGERGRHVYLCNRLKTSYGGEECQHLAGLPRSSTRRVSSSWRT